MPSRVTSALTSFRSAARQANSRVREILRDVITPADRANEAYRELEDTVKANNSGDETHKKVISKSNDVLSEVISVSQEILIEIKKISGNISGEENQAGGGGIAGALLGGALGFGAGSLLTGNGEEDEQALETPDDTGGGGGSVVDGSGSETGAVVGGDTGAPVEGAEGVRVLFEPGPERPNPPSEGVVNAVRNAVFETFGEGYSIRITSGRGEHGSTRHREAGGGAAIDYQIVRPDGSLVSIYDDNIEQYLANLGRFGIQGHGMGEEYMGINTFHSDIYPEHLYSERQGPTWGEGMTDDLRNVFLENRDPSLRPDTGEPVDVSEGVVVNLPELVPETPSTEPTATPPAETPEIPLDSPETPESTPEIPLDSPETPESTPEEILYASATGAPVAESGVTDITIPPINLVNLDTTPIPILPTTQGETPGTGTTQIVASNIPSHTNESISFLGSPEWIITANGERRIPEIIRFG